MTVPPLPAIVSCPKKLAHFTTCTVTVVSLRRGALTRSCSSVVVSYGVHSFSMSQAAALPPFLEETLGLICPCIFARADHPIFKACEVLFPFTSKALYIEPRTAVSTYSLPIHSSSLVFPSLPMLSMFYMLCKLRLTRCAPAVCVLMRQRAQPHAQGSSGRAR